MPHGTTLSELLEIESLVTKGGCRWRRGRCDDKSRLAEGVWLVAEEIMRLRCGRAAGIFDAWRAAALGGSPDADLSLAAPFIEPTFGLPPDGGSDDHAQGYVAEVTWRMLSAEEDRDNGDIVYLAIPDPDVTSPGADGFLVFSSSEIDALAFELWEIKKRVGSTGVSATIGGAYVQLATNAERYLAKVTSMNEGGGESAEFQALLAELVQAWREARESASAGVAVATSSAGLPNQAFRTMHNRFPGHATSGGGVRGCLIGLGDITDFALSVRRTLWNGLSAENG